METPTVDLASATERVGDMFRIDVDDGTSFDLELIEARRARKSPTGEQADTSFSLLFRGPTAPMLNQGIIPLHHDSWGLQHMFLVPISNDDDGVCYEAAFNV